MFEHVIATAQTLLADLDLTTYRAEVGDHLRAHHAIRDLPDVPTESAPLVCVDGGVAHEQTDSLTWIAAVGVSSDGTAQAPATMVLPVTASAERSRSMLMALCEVATALTVLDRQGEVWLDGSLATPLISIATGLLVSDPQTASLVSDVLTETNADVLIGDYVQYATQGQVRAMPKQDTASGYCHAWADQIGGETGQWLTEQRDRLVATSLLGPGQWLMPRPAAEALRVHAKTATDAPASVRAWSGMLEELLGYWRDEVDAHVTYFVPAHADTRAVKIEYTTAADSTDDAAVDLAGQLCARASAEMVGPRIREPLAQYQADALAKREVTSLITQLQGVAASKFMHTHPGAVTGYRT